MLTLGQAARLAGVGKTTLTRAIKAGRLSATRRDDGGYQIDPSELSRVYNVTPETAETITATGDAVRRATPEGDHEATPSDPELTTRLAVAEAELRALKDMLTELGNLAMLGRRRPSASPWRRRRGPCALPLRQTPAAPDQRRPWWRRLAG